MKVRKSIFILSVLALLLPALALASYPVEVPRTGQITCYDSTGAVIDCVGTGQDGSIQAGEVWPDPRFSERADGTVTDNLTGLVWVKNANLLGTVDADNDTDGTAGDGAVTWQHALDYIKKLNNENYLNHSDWRLPNVNELESLMNAELYLPLPLNHPFLNVQSSYIYWSSTSYAYNAFSAWGMGMIYGNVFGVSKTDGNGYVWPVRAGQCGLFDNSVICLPKTGQTTCYADNGTVIDCTGTGQDGDLQAGVAWPNPRFSVQGDNQTVTDNLTGLMWVKNANLIITRDPTFDADATVNDGMVNWQHALDYVSKLNSENYLNHTDWRLPNRRELRSLVDYGRYNPALPLNSPFTNVWSTPYWSSTSCAYYNYTSSAWIVFMYFDMGVDFDRKTGVHSYVWPVRAGQCGSFDNSTTTTTAAGSTTTTQPSTTTTAASTTSTVLTTTSTPATTTAVTTTAPSTTTSQLPSSTTTIPATTTTTIGGPCPAKKALGEDNPKLDNLRDFRDSRLAQSAIGRKIIQIYYNNAESINAALDRSPALRAVTRSVLEVFAPMVGKKK